MLTPQIPGTCWRLLIYFLPAENPGVLQVVKHVPWTKQTARHRLIFPNFTLRKSFQDRKNNEFSHSSGILVSQQRSELLLPKTGRKSETAEAPDVALSPTWWKPRWQADAAKLQPASLHGAILGYIDLSVWAGTCLNFLPPLFIFCDDTMLHQECPTAILKSRI